MAGGLVGALGVIGMILVLVSFVVKDWRWLYSFNMTGAFLLTIYAYLNRDMVFTILEAVIVAIQAYRLAGELKARRGGLETRVRSSHEHN